jgi:GTP-binding protein HflX
LETDRRLALDRISQVRRRLKKVQSNRTLMRTERSKSAIPSVALVGYTNAGKSSLMNAITDSEVGIRDELFHTLDPITRQFDHRGKAYVMTDTVGFIRKLPHQLVDAFGATLEETLEADLLLIVEDAAESDAEATERRLAVDSTLDQIGAGSVPRIRVLNKVDLLTDEERFSLTMVDPTALLVSAVTGDGIDELLDTVAARIGTKLVTVRLLIPYTEGGVLAELHRVAGDLEREDGADGVVVTARMRPDVAARWSRFSVE